MPALATSTGVGLGDVGLFSTLGFVTWLIPGFLLGMPGLLILVVVGAQIVGGGTFVPITRRVMGGVGLPRKRRPAAGDGR